MANKPTYEELEQRVKELEQTESERKQAEAALRESETILSMAGRTARFGGWSAHPDGQEVVWSEQVALIHEKQPGYSPTAKEAIKYYAPEWRDKIAEVLQKCTHEGTPYDEEMEIITAGGHRLWVRTTGEAIRDNLEEIVRVQGSFQDITEHKKAEDVLLKEKDFTENVIDAAQVIILVLDTEGRIVRFNPFMEKISGYKLDEVRGMDWFTTFLPEQDYERTRALFQRAVGNISTNGNINPIVVKDGREIIVEWHDKTLKDAEGKTIGLLCIGQDTTERKQAEEALKESEEKYRNILENIGEGYYEIDLTGNFTFFNDAMCRIRGYSRNELMGMNNREYMDPATAKKVFEVYNRIYATGKGIKGYGWGIIRKDGTKGYVEVSASLMKNSEDKPIGFRGIVRDVTEKKFLEEERKHLDSQFQQAQKMEAISTLAGGIAHEFNNALMGIMGNIELLKIELPEDERRDRFFEAMNGSGHRMSRLTDQLLAYAKGGKYQPKDLKLGDFVIETLPILQHEFNPEVRVETHFPKDLSFVNADNAQMQMVLSAILANSNEAIEDEGIIRITAENKDVDDNFRTPDLWQINI